MKGCCFMTKKFSSCPPACVLTAIRNSWLVKQAAGLSKPVMTSKSQPGRPGPPLLRRLRFVTACSTAPFRMMPMTSSKRSRKPMSSSLFIYYYDICGQLRPSSIGPIRSTASLTASVIFTSLPYRPTTCRTRQNGPYRRSMAGSAASTKPVMPVASTPAA